MADYKKEAGYRNNFYDGADYGLDPYFGKGDSFLGFETSYRIPASEIGLTTDTRSANQLAEVSKKLSTGAKVIEISGVSPEVWESVPQQHLKEINRLRKLSGVDLTFHGPVVDLAGVSRQGWDPSQREQAERQAWSAVQRAQKMDPDGNIVVTFHTSNGLPTPETSVFNEKTQKEEIKEFWVVDERTGNFQNIQLEKNYLEGQTKPFTKQGIINEIDKRNEDAWNKALQSANFHAFQGAEIIEKAISPPKAGVEEEKEKEMKKKILEDYKKFGTPEYEKELETAGAYGKIIKERMQTIVHGDLYLRDAYSDLRNLYNQAYDAAKRNNDQNALKKLDLYQENISPKLKYINDPSHVDELAESITKGINILKQISPPKTFTPLREFGIEKVSETVSNVALNAYKEFKDKSPIISIENPPVGMGLARAEDLKDVVERAREKFIQKAKEKGIPEFKAKEQANKLIGATWDVGHINMLRKYGYGEEHLLKETGKIAPFVKHIHLSDNFGLEHTEIPMGMGNVPVKKEMELIAEYNKKAKKIIETGGNWYQFFQKSPLRETLEAFGSPIYGMKMANYWNQVPALTGGYFSGQGATLPDIHFQTYGSGFSGLPMELGGQIGGKSRVSGNPME